MDGRCTWYVDLVTEDGEFLGNVLCGAPTLYDSHREHERHPGRRIPAVNGWATVLRDAFGVAEVERPR